MSAIEELVANNQRFAAALADGIVCDRAVICPLHDRRYDLATGEALGAGEPVVAHSVELRDDRVFVEVSAPLRVAA